MKALILEKKGLRDTLRYTSRSTHGHAQINTNMHAPTKRAFADQM